MSVIGSNVLAGASGQSAGGGGGGAGGLISRSLRFNSGDSSFLNRTPSAAGDRTTWTWSGWLKTGSGLQAIFGSTAASNFFAADDQTVIYLYQDKLNIYDYQSGNVINKVTERLFRDPSAWFHLVISIETGASTAEDRVKLYVNGQRETAFGTNVNPSQNATTILNSTAAQYIACPNDFFNGYLADVHFIDGQALAATDFGETDDNGVWQPKKFDGTYGPLVNQSQTWSSSTGITDSSGTRSSAYIFDGVITGSHSNGFNTYNSTITLANSVTATSSIRFYGAFENASGVRYTVNGTTTDAQPPEFSGNTAFGWASVTNVSFPVTINNVGLTDSSTTNGGRFVGIEIDGKLLVDSTVSLADNSFHLPFSDNSSNAALGTDTSGNSNTWTVNNLVANRESVSTDTISNVASISGGQRLTFPTNNNFTSFATGDAAAGAIAKYKSSQSNSNATIASNGLTVNYGSTPCIAIAGEVGASSAGNYYYEVTCTTNQYSPPVFSCGVVNENFVVPTAQYPFEDTGVFGYSSREGSVSVDGTTSVSGSGSIALNTVIGVLLDYGAKTLKIYANGSLQHTITGLTGTVFKPFGDMGNIYGGAVATANFGDTAFAHAPSGITIKKFGLASISAINSAGPTIDVDGGSFYGSDASGTSGGATVISTTAVTNGDNFVDSPTNGTQSDTGAGGEVVGNYATWNPLTAPSAITLSDGNLNFSTAGSNAKVLSTIGMSSGKFYWEVIKTSGSNGNFGIATGQSANTTYLGGDAYGWGMATDGNIYHNASLSSYGSTWGTDDVIGVAFDADAGSLYYYINGVVQNSGTAAFTGLTAGPYFASGGDNGCVGNINFGSRPFEYAAPTGFKCLCTSSLPQPTIADGSQYFDTKLWTGTGSSQAITGYNFSPDFAWIKDRGSAQSHALFDVVRGATKGLHCDLTASEWTGANTLSAFNNNGFTLGGHDVTNYSSNTYVGWAWDAGTSTVTNNDGSIASQVRAQPSAGFSIVSFTNGDGTVGHGLSAPPEFIITKRLDSAYTWGVYSKPTTKDAYLALNSTQASSAVSGMWGSAEPTSSVFGTTFYVAPVGSSMIAYCFAPVEGYSAMGKYTGNGSTDGPFVYTGFKIAWLLIKTTATSEWRLHDATRDPYNVADTLLFPDTNEVENTHSNYNVDMLSNGFKLRTSHGGFNTSGTAYIYIAFASNPFASNGGLAR